MNEYTIRVYYRVLGGHTHIRVFTGKTGFTLGKAGDLCMTNEEFEAWKNNVANCEFLESVAE